MGSRQCGKLDIPSYITKDQFLEKLSWDILIINEKNLDMLEIAVYVK